MLFKGTLNMGKRNLLNIFQLFPSTSYTFNGDFLIAKNDFLWISQIFVNRNKEQIQ